MKKGGIFLLRTKVAAVFFLCWSCGVFFSVDFYLVCCGHFADTPLLIFLSDRERSMRKCNCKCKCNVLLL